MTNILIVDDDEGVARALARVLRRRDYAVEVQPCAAAALDQLGGVDLLITDHRMPSMTGTQLAAAARVLRPDLPVILVSGSDDRRPACAASAFLTKPWDMQTLLDTIRAVLPNG